MTDVLIVFFALLSLISLAGAGTLLVMMIGRGTRAAAVREVGEYALPAAVAVAVVSMLGSLFMSEVAGFIPCRLCWVQRGCMYPAAILLVAALIWKWRWIAWAVIPLSAAGALTAVFHYGEQRGWVGGSEGFCDAAVPCSGIWVDQFGFVTIPFMALAGFLFVGALMWLHLAARRG